MSNCRECQAEVSTSAKACPQCGADKPARKLVFLNLTDWQAIRGADGSPLSEEVRKGE